MKTNSRINSLALALVLGFPACAVEDLPVDQQTDEILEPQGVVTTVRPEIGIYMNTDGHGNLTTFGCTGTLIAPDVVVTANHCLPGSFPPPFPQVFIVGGYDGPRYVVDRYYRVALDLATLETTPTKNGLGLYAAEVGLLHLITPVPASVATPATIGINLPAEGTTVTTFGFGCTNGTTQAEDFLKRYASFTIGVTPHVLCHGDSGGPVMYSTYNDHGDLFAINSGMGFSTGYGVGDEFSDVSSHKLEIEDVIHGWHGTSLETNVLRVGTVYKTTTASNAYACSDLCKQDGPCRSFRWTSNTCLLQSDTPDFFPAVGWTSGLAPALEYGVDRPGSDYLPPLALALPEQCAAACTADVSRCKAWSFDMAVGQTPPRCYLKSAVPASVANANVISGVADRLLEVGFDRPGGDISTVASSSPSVCREQCAGNSICRAFSWASNQCHLKGSVPNAVASSPVTSGVRRGLETNINRAGANLSSFDTSDPSPLVCQSRCATSSTCKAWTYVQQPNSNPLTASTYTCYLKSEIAAAQFDTRSLISGIKGLEFLPAPSH